MGRHPGMVAMVTASGLSSLAVSQFCGTLQSSRCPPSQCSVLGTAPTLRLLSRRPTRRTLCATARGARRGQPRVPGTPSVRRGAPAKSRNVPAKDDNSLKAVIAEAALQQHRDAKPIASDKVVAVGATAGLGALAAMVHKLRLVSGEQRRELLMGVNAEDLKGLCLKLRVKTTGGQEVLVNRIFETMSVDDELFLPENPLGKMARRLGRMPDAAMTVKFMTSQHKSDDLKKICRSLRIAVSGKKEDLAHRIIDEFRNIAPHLEFLDADTSTSPMSQLAPDDCEPSEAEAVYQQPVAPAEPVQAAYPQPVASAEPTPAVLEQTSAPLEPREAAYEQPRVPAAYEQPRVPVEPAEAAYEQPRVPVEPAEAAYEQPAAPVESSEAVYAQPVAVAELEAEADASPRTARRTSRPAEVAMLLESQNSDLESEKSEAGGDFVHTSTRQSVADLEQDQMEKRQQRKFERRKKLAGFLAEELATVFGADQKRYIEDMKRTLGAAPDRSQEAYLLDKLEPPKPQKVAMRVPTVLGPSLKVPEFGGWHSEQHQQAMTMVGEIGPSRQAWCNWWDQKTGCGELVDLDDRQQIAVVSSALQTGANVSPKLKYLRHGEFVEYRRVQRPGSIDRAVLVRGIKGWPLMCEVDGLEPPALGSPESTDAR